MRITQLCVYVVKCRWRNGLTFDSYSALHDKIEQLRIVAVNFIEGMFSFYSHRIVSISGPAKVTVVQEMFCGIDGGYGWVGVVASVKESALDITVKYQLPQEGVGTKIWHSSNLTKQ